jgi:hypothetical protein
MRNLQYEIRLCKLPIFLVIFGNFDMTGPQKFELGKSYYSLVTSSHPKGQLVVEFCQGVKGYTISKANYGLLNSLSTKIQTSD